jgi:hypothetical protein
MAGYQLSRKELIVHFQHQNGFLRVPADVFDAGGLPEAKRLRDGPVRSSGAGGASERTRLSSARARF